jgi:hypothetical protein
MQQQQRHRSSSVAPAQSSPSVEDNEDFEVDGPGFGDDEENERCTQVHVEITRLKNEECAGTATSYAAMAMRKSRAKQQAAADTAVPWRYQGQ